MKGIKDPIDFPKKVSVDTGVSHSKSWTIHAPNIEGKIVYKFFV